MQQKILVAIVLVLAFMGFALAGLLGVAAHTDPGEMDTSAYLSTAWQIRQTGGIAKHLENCWSGVYKEATQHPLYLLVLSIFAEKNIHFFVNAKKVGWVTGFIFLGVFFTVTRKLLGLGASLLGLCLVLLNATFIHMSTMVACEGFFALFFILFWFFAAQGFTNNKYWLLAGFFAALTFLTKSLGILTLPIFVFSLIFISVADKKFHRLNRWFLGFFLIFMTVASPLFIRNLRHHGTPLYSDSTAVLWIDQWRDFYRPDIQKNPPTMAQYLRTHSLTDMASTYSKGLYFRTPRMFSDGLKPMAFWEKPVDLKKIRGFYQQTASWQGAWAFILTLLSFIALWILRRNADAVCAFISIFFFIFFVAWFSKIFPGDPPTRLLYPIFFLIIAYAAKALWHALDTILFKLPPALKKVWAMILSASFLAYFAMSLAINYDWKKIDIQKSYTFTNPFVAQLLWAGSNTQKGERIMVGAIFMSYLFYVDKAIKAEVILWPQVDSLNELEGFIRERQVTHGILDLATAAYNLKVYGPYFEVGPGIGLRPKETLPEFFQFVYQDPNPMSLYEIYAFNAAS